MVDWNNDGLKDLLVGEFNGNVRYFRNIGTTSNPQLTCVGTLQVGGEVLRVDYDATPFVDDWNGDGLKDLLIGAIDGRVWLYLNVGTNTEPVFDEVNFVTLANGDTLRVPTRSAPCVLDLDSDGTKELLLGENFGRAFYYENLGTNSDPQLADSMALMMGDAPVNPGFFSRFSPLDWDGDGALDLVGGSFEGFLKLYRQVPATGPGPIVYMNFQGPNIVPDTGAILNFSCNAENNSAQTLQFDLWTEICGPQYRYYQVMPPAVNLTLDPGGYIAHEFMPRVPAIAPPGSYMLRIFAGDFQRRQVFDTDEFYFEKVLGRDGAMNNTAAPSLVAPNPFNHSTTLSFHLAEVGLVRIVIYNTAGVKITTLIDDQLAAGSHKVTWEASSLPSGIYFAYILAGKVCHIEKLLLTK
jgi:hypothetical protein